jgi:hypothetical protein
MYIRTSAPSLFGFGMTSGRSIGVVVLVRRCLHIMSTQIALIAPSPEWLTGVRRLRYVLRLLFLHFRVVCGIWDRSGELLMGFPMSCQQSSSVSSATYTTSSFVSDVVQAIDLHSHGSSPQMKLVEFDQTTVENQSEPTYCSQTQLVWASSHRSSSLNDESQE